MTTPEDFARSNHALGEAVHMVTVWHHWVDSSMAEGYLESLIPDDAEQPRASELDPDELDSLIGALVAFADQLLREAACDTEGCACGRDAQTVLQRVALRVAEAAG
jgi:hypothetical protein